MKARSVYKGITYLMLVSPVRLCIPAILTVGMCAFSSMRVNAQDTIPASKNNIEYLKRSLDQVATDTRQATTLLQSSKDLNYLPGQVVALCQLAGINDSGQAGASSKNLQEAQQIAAQIKDMSGGLWAIREVGKIQRHFASGSRELKKGLSDVLITLGKSMTSSKPELHLNAPAISYTGAVKRDSNYSSAIKQAKKYMQDIKKQMANIPYAKDVDFTDDWLDSLTDMGTSSRKATKRLIAQKASRDSIRALSAGFAKKGDYAQAYKSFLTYTKYKDSLTAEVSNRRLAQLKYDQQLQKRDAQIKLLNKDKQLKEQAANRQLFYMFALFGCVVALTVILLILNRNNRMKRKANEQLNTQKEELRTALTELKNTQTQLVHTEKMASLGELTAGIAHEIQNPLNFVNNFSEVSAELVRELIDNQKMPEIDRELDMELLNDVDQNLQKVALHGKRASAIIKRMLEHSRAGSSEKERTNMDALVDEYLKLSYHGMRSRDRSFEVKMLTDFKSDPQSVNIVPQEIGRVLLNIFNNAFYAVQQRQKESGDGFEPTVIVTSYHEDGQVTIKIKDNGTGMPEQVMKKIFQPFFTTKPTGEGTGLGLSLSYDIITKGHGGTLSVISEVNSYTEFTITLPAL